MSIKKSTIIIGAALLLLCVMFPPHIFHYGQDSTAKGFQFIFGERDSYYGWLISSAEFDTKTFALEIFGALLIAAIINFLPFPKKPFEASAQTPKESN